ncbi:MAG TPA: hypothetical protein VHO47_00580 [Candidatus Babeliales bacterium]|nr:hypothetical protein [Candidatus Babeliales bacterium]
MIINATFFVQMINFAIAYIALDRILLRAVVKDIQTQSQQDRALTAQLEKTQKRIEELKKQEVTQWREWQNIFKLKLPQLNQQSAVINEELILKPEEPDKSKVGRMRNEIAGIIVKRVGAFHDRP